MNLLPSIKKLLHRRLTFAIIGLGVGLLGGVQLTGLRPNSVTVEATSPRIIVGPRVSPNPHGNINSERDSAAGALEHSVEDSYRKAFTDRIIALGEIRQLSICNFSDLKLERRISKALGLTQDQERTVNTAMEVAFGDLMKLEEAAARLINKENGDQVLEIKKFDGAGVKNKLLDNIRQSIPPASADILVGLIESSPQFGRFGQQRQEVWIDGEDLASVAGVKPVNLGNYQYDDSGKPIGFTGTYLVSAEFYKQRYGSLITQLLPK